MAQLSGWLARHAAGERTWTVRLLALAFGLTLFGAVIPWLLLKIASAVSQQLHCECSGPWALAVAAVLLVGGTALMLGAVATQVVRGHGTPVPVVPTQHLLTTGVYALCRNPMKLGFIGYATGLTLALTSPAGALVVALLLAAIGSAYHKGVEERELALRFGQPYLGYKAVTPFVIPTWRSLRRALGRPV